MIIIGLSHDYHRTVTCSTYLDSRHSLTHGNFLTVWESIEHFLVLGTIIFWKGFIFLLHPCISMSFLITARKPEDVPAASLRNVTYVSPSSVHGHIEQIHHLQVLYVTILFNI